VSPLPTATMAKEVAITNDAVTSFSFETETDGMTITDDSNFAISQVFTKEIRYNPKAAFHEGPVSDCVCFLVNDISMSFSSDMELELDGDSLFSDE